MAIGRKPTTTELNEIIADMVSIYKVDENLMPYLQDRGDIVGHKNNTDEEEAKYYLSQARVIISDMNDEKAGVIFWGGETGGFPSLIRESADGKLYIVSERYTTMLWGA